VMHLKVLISVDLGKRSAMIVSALVPMAWVFLQVSQGSSYIVGSIRAIRFIPFQSE